MIKYQSGLFYLRDWQFRGFSVLYPKYVFVRQIVRQFVLSSSSVLFASFDLLQCLTIFGFRQIFFRTKIMKPLQRCGKCPTNRRRKCSKNRSKKICSKTHLWRHKVACLKSILRCLMTKPLLRDNLEFQTKLKMWIWKFWKQKLTLIF